jgi:hypothetical protein
MGEHCKADDVLHGKSEELVISHHRRPALGRNGPEENFGSTPSQSSLVADPSAELDDLSLLLGNLAVRYMSHYLNQSWSMMFVLHVIIPSGNERYIKIQR